MHFQVEIVSGQSSNIGLLRRSQQCDYCCELNLDLRRTFHECGALAKEFNQFYNLIYILIMSCQRLSAQVLRYLSIIILSPL